MNNVTAGIVSVLTAIVGVAALAVIFSPRAQTGSVIRESGRAFSGALTAAQGAVSGNGGMGAGLTLGAW